MITAFNGTITKVLINGTQVFPGTGSIKLEPGKTMTIEIHYSVIPVGDIAWNDYWTVGVVAKMNDQFGWDPTQHRGSGEKTGTPQIGNIKSPAVKSGLSIKLCAIDEVNPSAPSY